MDLNRKVGIVFIPKSGDISPVVRQYRSLFGQIKADAEKFSKDLNNSFKNFGGAVQSKTTIFDDKELKRAQSVIKRYQSENARAERELTAQIEREAKTQTQIKIREAKRANDAAIRELKERERAEKQSVNNSQGIFTSALGGSFFGNLGANAVTFFIGKLSQLPALVSDIIGEAVKLSEEKLNASKGLESIANFKGIDSAEAKKVVDNLRLVKGGIVDATSASSALKSLLATGFSLDKANALLERFSDSAAFGKQSALDFNQAIERTAEGLKQGNSNLFDAAGITKNLSVILKERGFELEDLSDKTKKQAALDALYQGILAETAAQMGDADKILQGYTGSASGLEMAYKQLYTAAGDLITQNPYIIAANKAQAEQVRELTGDITKQGSETQKTANDWIEFYAKVKAGSIPFAAVIKNTFATVFAAVSGLAAGVMGVVSGVLETVANGIRFTLGSMYNSVVDTINSAIGLSKSLPAGLGGLLSQASPITTRANTDFNYDFTEKFFGGFKAAMADAAEYQKKANASVLDLNNALVSLERNVTKSRTTGAAKGGLLTTFGGDALIGGDSNRSGGTKKKEFQLSSQAKAVIEAADRLGVSPLDLAAIIGFETGGTYSPNKVGGAGNRYRGLIQFGAAEQKDFGVFKGQSFEDQITKSVVEYFKTRFASVGRSTQGASLLELYTTVIAGNPNANINAKDAFGTSALSGSQKIAREFKPQALNKFFGGSLSNIGGEFPDVGSTKPFVDETALKKQKIFLDNLEKLSELSKEAREDQQAYSEAWDDFLDSITKRGDDQLQNLQEELDLLGATTEAERQRIRDIQETITLRRQLADEGRSTQEIEEAIKALQISQEELNVLREKLRIKQLSVRADEFGKSLDSELESLLRNGRELSAYEQTLRTLNTEYKNLSQVEKDNLLSKAAQIDAIREAQRSYEKFKDITRDLVDSFLDGGFKGLFDSIKNQFKRFLADMITEFLTSQFFKIFSGKGAGQSGGGFLSNIFGGLFGGRSSGGSGNSGGGLLGSIFGGNAGGGIFNFGGSSAGTPRGVLGNIQGNWGGLGAGNQGGFLSSIFSAGGLSSAAATAGVSVGVAALMASLQTNSPKKGALLGGLVGFISATLRRNSLRKKEEKARTGFINDALSGLGGLDTIISDTKNLKYEPPSSALTAADALAKQIREQYLAQSSALTDKKTRNIALKDVSRIDSAIAQKMAELRAAVTLAEGYGATDKSLVSVFADGGFLGQYKDFKRRNGFLPGDYSRGDVIPAMLAGGEMILNPRQQQRVRMAAGFDAFQYAQIPNYAAGAAAQNNAAAQIIVQNNVTLVLEGDTFDEKAKAYLESEDGSRVAVKIVRDGTILRK